MKIKRFDLQKTLAILAALMLLLVVAAGCSPDDEEGESGAIATDTAEELPEEAQNYIDQSRQALAEQLGIDESAIELDSITAPPTEDGTYIILLMYDGETFEYHGRNGEVMLVSDGLPTVPALTATPGTEEEVTFSYSPALVEDAEVIVDVDAETPVVLVIRGQLRSGCEELYEHSVEMTGDATFAVELIASRMEGVACTQALIGYEETIAIEEAADLPAGQYNVVVNDELTTSFTWPGIEGEVIGDLPVVEVGAGSAVYTSVMSDVVPLATAEEGVPFWEVLPTHTVLTFTDYPHTDSLHQPRIAVYPVNEWIEMDDTAADEIQSLVQLLDEQPDLAITDTLPYLPLPNAAQALVARAGFIDFDGGSGIRYLTQHQQAENPINNQALVYTFQGLTADGRYYVSAVFPIAHPDLPADPEAGVEDISDSYDEYVAGVVELLNQSEASAFTPDLSALDSLINSLTISQGSVPSAPDGETQAFTEADLVRQLEDAGAEVRLSTEPIDAADILAVPGNVIFVNGEELQVYIYDTAEAAMEDAGRISADGFEIGPAPGSDGGAAIVDWIAPPHFYRWDNIIVLYVGEDGDMLNLLNDVLGEPFAGGEQ